MKIAFFGTDDFSVAVLEELKRAGFLPALIITAPDKPRGRGLKVFHSPAKLWARENKVKSLQPEKLDQTNTILLASKIVDCFIVASYGKIIPKSILDIPKYGALNVHPSLLPRYRGPSPIESQILADEKDIGVTIMQVTEKMDAGPIVAQQRWEHTHIPKGSELKKELAEMGGKLLAEVIPRLLSRDIKPVPQDESEASYTKKFTKAEGEINLTDAPYKNFLKIRAFEGGVGTYFYIEKSSPSPSFNKGGEGGGFSTQQIRVKITDAEFRDGKLLITRVIPEGKKEMGYEEFLRGLK